VIPAKRDRGAIQKLTQYTHRLSIQNEGGSRFTGPAEAARVCDSSFLWTCLRGECSKIDPSLRGYVADLPFMGWKPAKASKSADRSKFDLRSWLTARF